MPTRPLAQPESFHQPRPPGRDAWCWNWDVVVRFCHDVARAQTSRADLAEDAAQEAALRAWRHRARCREPGDPAPWLAAIVRREVRRAAGRVSPVACTAEMADIACDLHVLERTVDRIAVATAMRRLRSDERALMVLRYVEDLTQPAIAARLGIPEGTVKIRLHRARARMRKDLAAE
jgi:RNA polymerase sigma-70 factor, ECF subfamily